MVLLGGMEGWGRLALAKDWVGSFYLTTSYLAWVVTELGLLLQLFLIIITYVWNGGEILL